MSCIEQERLCNLIQDYALSGDSDDTYNKMKLQRLTLAQKKPVTSWPISLFHQILCVFKEVLRWEIDRKVSFVAC